MQNQIYSPWKITNLHPPKKHVFVTAILKMLIFFHLTEEFICCSLFQALKIYLMWSYGNVSVKHHCHWSAFVVTEMVKSFSLPFEVKMIKAILQRDHSGKSTLFTKCKLVFGLAKVWSGHLLPPSLLGKKPERECPGLEMMISWLRKYLSCYKNVYSKAINSRFKRLLEFMKV